MPRHRIPKAAIEEASDVVLAAQVAGLEARCQFCSTFSEDADGNLNIGARVKASSIPAQASGSLKVEWLRTRQSETEQLFEFEIRTPGFVVSEIDEKPTAGHALDVDP